MVKRLRVYLPDYRVDTEPDHKTIGKVVDDEIRKFFFGKTIVVRGISSIKHPNKTINQLLEIIEKTGTDRYDHTRAGDRYKNIQGKHIDIFAFRRKVTSGMQLFKYMSWGFYHGSKKIHGMPERIDIVMIYDAAQLRAVVHQYEGEDNLKRDGYVFKKPENKAAALLATLIID